MPNISLAIIDHVVVLVLVALLPWNGRTRFDLLVKRDDAGNPGARMRAYRTVLVEKWLSHRGDRHGVDRTQPQHLVDRVDSERHSPSALGVCANRTGDRGAPDAWPIGCPQRTGA